MGFWSFELSQIGECEHCWAVHQIQMSVACCEPIKAFALFDLLGTSKGELLALHQIIKGTSPLSVIKAAPGQVASLCTPRFMAIKRVILAGLKRSDCVLTLYDT
jgi:hypothetical protein